MQPRAAVKHMRLVTNSIKVNKGRFLHLSCKSIHEPPNCNSCDKGNGSNLCTIVFSYHYSRVHGPGAQVPEHRSACA